MSMSACLSARNAELCQIFVHDAFGFGSILLWLAALQYVMHFRFCGWRHVFILWGWATIKQDVMFRSSPGGSICWAACEFIRMWHRGKVSYLQWISLCSQYGDDSL